MSQGRPSLRAVELAPEGPPRARTGFEVRVTPYGRRALDLLGAHVDEVKGGDRLAPVTVIVPSNYAALSSRRALAARPGGAANLSFITLYRLAERLGGRSLAASDRKPASTLVIAQALRDVLSSEPGCSLRWRDIARPSSHSSPRCGSFGR